MIRVIGNITRVLKGQRKPERPRPRPDSQDWFARLVASIQAEPDPEPEPLADGFTRIDKTEAGTEVYRVD